MHYHRSYYLLQKAKARIADIDKWTRHALARNSKGEEVAPDHPEAVCWCAQGAVHFESTGYIQTCEAESKLQAASEEICGCTDYTRLNDALEHSDVMLMFDKAIAKAQGV